MVYVINVLINVQFFVVSMYLQQHHLEDGIDTNIGPTSYNLMYGDKYVLGLITFEINHSYNF